jgi:serine phosphatase RsbU (regulator of sigma subunit)
MTAPRPTSRSRVSDPRSAARRDLDRTGLLLGLGLLAAMAIVYPTLREQADSPLSVFLLPTLLTAALSGVRQTSIVAGAAFAVAWLEGLTGGQLDGLALAARLAIVVVASGTAILLVAYRRRRDEQLRLAFSTASTFTAFQRGLVPSLRPPPGVSAESRYRAGEQRLRLGGDFLDVVTLPDGAVGFVIGDVSGHGPDAAAFGVSVRSGWKSIAMSMPTDPVAWCALVESAFFRDDRFDGFVTLLTGRFDPSSGRGVLVTAGHPWPILVGPEPHAVPMPRGPLLGPLSPTPRTPIDLDLGADEGLLLYTDGLIENRKQANSRERWNQDDLVAQVSAYRRADDVDLDAVMAHFEGDGFADDVALLLLHRIPTPH